MSSRHRSCTCVTSPCCLCASMRQYWFGGKLAYASVRTHRRRKPPWPTSVSKPGHFRIVCYLASHAPQLNVGISLQGLAQSRSIHTPWTSCCLWPSLPKPAPPTSNSKWLRAIHFSQTTLTGRSGVFELFVNGITCTRMHSPLCAHFGGLMDKNGGYVAESNHRSKGQILLMMQAIFICDED